MSVARSTRVTRSVAPQAVLDLPVWVRLFILVAASLLALGACLVTMLAQKADADHDQQRLSDLQFANALVLKLERGAVDLKVTATDAVLRTGRGPADPGAQQLDDQLATTKETISQLAAIRLDGSLKASAGRITTAFTEYGAVVRRFVDGAFADPVTARAGWEQVGVDNYLVSAVASNERELFGLAIDREQSSASASRRQTTLSVVITVVLAALVLVALAWIVVRSITGPLLRVRTTLAAVAEGDLTVSCAVTSNDELGQMATALDHVLEGLRTTVTSVARTSEAMAVSSDELDVVSRELTSTAGAASDQAQQAGTSARDISGSAESISGATQEMISSISEISQQALSAASVAADAVQTVAETSQAVEALDAASEEIGEIIQTITSIAEQTNLLALNATIEAARAGAAGAGFAVVASEVKELARETATATDDITGKISAIQATTERAITTIGRISAIIRQINEKQTTIASAVEEQSTVTQAMSGHIAHISSGTTLVATAVGEITEGTLATTRAAVTTAESATRLGALSSETRALLSHFRY
ncbi:MAG: methyl-accepting chemotaxis protein [Actinomycetota bacterium]|nr:methyl-accepting chemotaxis protein [Actinomycetota bacterium]